jgi:hypothetical protein
MAQASTRATTTRKSTNGGTDATANDATGNTEEQSRLAAVMSGAQDAADVARQTAERAAARLPDAVATARVTAHDTQVVLDEMDDQALVAGTTFSLGLGIGLFVSGAHRLLVVAALIPAIAMALTLIGRQQPKKS